MEGWKQILDLAASHWIELLLFEDAGDPRLRTLLARSHESCRLTRELMSKLSAVETCQGILAFFKKPAWCWSDLTPFVLFLDGLQDPGNLGTLLRTARATGLFSLASTRGTVSPFNAKAVRSSAASVLSTPLLEGVDMMELKKRGYRLVATTTGQGTPLFEVNLSPPIAVALGSEGGGLGGQVLDSADQIIHIPMHPASESLNAAVAGALILYEVYRKEVRP